MKAALAAILVLLTAAHAVAGACYSRTYSDEHLRKNPNQTVRSMVLRFTSEGDERYASVRVTFRDRDTEYSQGLICWDPDKAKYGEALIGCSVECDGGSFVARTRGEDAILIETRNGFMVSGDCGEEDLRWVKDKDAAKTVYKLFETHDAYCLDTRN